jgi:hypothetical protein
MHAAGARCVAVSQSACPATHAACVGAVCCGEFAVEVGVLQPDCVRVTALLPGSVPGLSTFCGGAESEAESEGVQEKNWD